MCVIMSTANQHIPSHWAGGNQELWDQVVVTRSSGSEHFKAMVGAMLGSSKGAKNSYFEFCMME